jgi:iron(III) transport system ATP-binding protein
VDASVTSPTADTGEAGRLQAAGLVKSFGSVPVLTGVDLDVPAGEVAAVLGPSGCGKTTLLRIIAGFLRADRGKSSLGGVLLFDDRTSLAPERRGIGVVPQEGALFPHLSVGANIGFGLARGSGREKRVAELLEMVGLAGSAGARPHELSGGQQQRVALARALAPNPALVLLDEPFSSLDAALRVHVREEIGRVLRDAKCTAVLVTHDQEEALSLADLVAVMLGGVIAQAGSPRDVYTAPVSLEVATFVGDAVLLAGDARDGAVRTALGRHNLARPVAAGSVRVVVRPEQFVVDPAGVSAEVVDCRYYGADGTIRGRLANGEHVVARVREIAAIGDRVGLRVDGDVLAYT